MIRARNTSMNLVVTPIALAVMLGFAGQSIAQVARDTTSADTPEAKSLFESGGQASIGPRPFTSFLDRLSSPVDKIVLKSSTDNLPADGVSATTLNIELIGRNGAKLNEAASVTIDVSGGARLQIPGRLTNESQADAGDLERGLPGTQLKIQGGSIALQLIAPGKAEDVRVRVSVGGVAEQITVRFVPDLRELIAVGLLEGRLRSNKFDPAQVLPATDGDLFDREIKSFSKEFQGGKTVLGARAALYLKGKVKGDYLLTLNYDSDKDTPDQLFNSIDPNAFYPVYGDASVRGSDAQSVHKLYLRLERAKNYLLYGDYTTQDDNPARVLGNYSRTLPGIRGHYEDERLVANAFVAQQAYRQVVDEFPGRGVSGPYSVTNPNGLVNSEKIELLIRSRFQQTQILKVTPLARNVDYEFEPFSGKIVFRSPIPSVDDQLNPVSIRITYEVEQNVDKFAVYGADVRLKITPAITLGAAIAKDKNPSAPFDLLGANIALKLSKHTEIMAEVARSTSVVNTSADGSNANNAANFKDRAGEFTGNAVRVELRHSSDTLRAQARISKADEDFNNASSGSVAGRTDVSLAGAWKATDRFTITAELQTTDDSITKAESTTGMLGAELRLTDQLSIGAGVRKAQQNRVSLAQTTASSCSFLGGSTGTGGATVGNITGYNTGFGINPVGSQAIDPSTGRPVVCDTAVNADAADATPELDRTQAYARVAYRPVEAFEVSGELSRISGTDATSSVKLGARWQATPRLGLNAELSRELSAAQANQYRLGADWRVGEQSRLFARYENSQTYGGAYGLGTGPLQRGLAVGFDSQLTNNSSLYSEYRLRNAASGRDVQSAIGLRNTVHVSDGLRILTNIERLNATSGDTTALGVGLEYTASPLWKSSGRVEWRQDLNNTNVLFTVGVARKLDREWTFLARDYFNQVDPRTAAGGDLRQNRLQLGFAYRPVDTNNFDALGSFENRYENGIAQGQLSTEPQEAIYRNVNILSLRANYHPSRPWWVSGRVAYKRVSEVLSGTPTNYTAQLIGGRVTYDITNRWSIGALASVLQGSDDSRRTAYGLEVGYVLMDNLWVTLGYNWKGFTDRDLSGADLTNRGWVLGLRYKFDEDIFKRDDPSVNKTLTPTSSTTPAQK
jgi:hypothetical protein